ncbi:MAG: MFS transporter, partial [Treponema sp.]|nr:MFS transporter [Treponema sp.]
VGNIDANYDILHIIGGLLAGYCFSKKIGQKLTIVTGTVLMSLSLLFCYIFIANLNVFLVLNLFAGFGMGVAYITLMSLSIKDCVHKHSRMGFFQSIYMLGVYYAPKVCEQVTKWTSLNNVYIVCGVLGVCSLVLLLFIPPRLL